MEAEHKKRIIIGVSVAVFAIALAIIASFMDKQVATSGNSRPLPATYELDLQKRLQEIVSKNIESDCDTLGDARYRRGCHSFFENKSKVQ